MQVEQHQSAEIKDNKTVELLFNGESKIGQLAVSPSEDYWNSLEKLFHASYPSIEAGAAIQAKYIDDEGDLIILDSDDELRNALNNAATKPNPLRLELFLANDQGEKKKRIRKTREERLQIKADRLKAKEEKLNLGDGDQEKIQKKKARIEEKLKRKQERQEKKKHLSREERLALKEEKKKKREEKKKMRMQGEGDLEEKKKKKRHEERMKELEERKKKTSNIAYLDLIKEEEDNSGTWPEHATQLFLDGNNMMFVTGGLRGLTLHHKRAKAEQLLEAAAHAFVVSQAGRIQQATVIFDNTHTDKSVLLEVEGVASVPFRVCSARPQWPTSDDALIEWAKDAQKKKEADRMAIVTSDRALSVQLQEAGATLIKPKQFLHFAFKTVTKNQNGSGGDAELDAWLESLIA